MLTFKQWLTEVSFSRAHISINPKTPAEAFSQVGPESMVPVVDPETDKDKYVFKALYSSHGDVLAAWWAGNATHDTVLDMILSGRPKVSSNGIQPEDFPSLLQKKTNFIAYLYFDARVRHLEIAASIKLKGNKDFEKFLYVGRLGKFIKKFKTIDYIDFRSSRFKRFI